MASSGEPLNSRHEIWNQETRNIALSRGVKRASISWTV